MYNLFHVTYVLYSRQNESAESSIVSDFSPLGSVSIETFKITLNILVT